MHTEEISWKLEEEKTANTVERSSPIHNRNTATYARSNRTRTTVAKDAVTTMQIYDYTNYDAEEVTLPVMDVERHTDHWKD
jgi:hypothetical protein